MKSGVSIIIVQKTPSQIKHFFQTLESLDNHNDIQRYAQQVYVEDCFSLEKSLYSEGKLLFCFQCTNQALSASFILSSNRKRFVINEGTAGLLCQGDRKRTGNLPASRLSADRQSQDDRHGIPQDSRLRQKKAVPGLYILIPPLSVKSYSRPTLNSKIIDSFCLK